MFNGRKNNRILSFFLRHPTRLAIFVIVFMLCGLSYVIIQEQKAGAGGRGSTLTRQQFASRRRPKSACPDYPNKPVSLSNPPFYPKHGTGIAVNVSHEFDSAHLHSFCDTSPPLAAVLPVYSAVENFSRRMAIRDTIGRGCQKLNCKVIFILAFTPHELLMQRLRLEYDNYRDIMIIDFVDTYRDLNNKAVAMLDWLVDHCATAKYVIHFIDDTYVNVDLYLQDLPTIGPSVYGAMVLRSDTIRDVRSRHYTSIDEYPYEKLPTFVSGNAYAFPNSVTKALRCAVPHAIYNWVEDMWLMGHVRELAGIKAVQTKHLEEKLGRQFPDTEMKVERSFEQVHEFLFIHSIVAEDYYRFYYLISEQKQNKDMVVNRATVKK